jgi:hypothetical protein
MSVAPAQRRRSTPLSAAAGQCRLRQTAAAAPIHRQPRQSEVGCATPESSAPAWRHCATPSSAAARRCQLRQPGATAPRRRRPRQEKIGCAAPESSAPAWRHCATPKSAAARQCQLRQANVVCASPARLRHAVVSSVRTPGPGFAKRRVLVRSGRREVRMARNYAAETLCRRYIISTARRSGRGAASWWGLGVGPLYGH